MASNESPPPQIDIAAFVRDLGMQSQAGTVMIMSARLEQSLEWILQGHMPNLPKELKDKLYKGYGPLSTFSAKIDTAFALGLVTSEVNKTLNAVKIIRNAFAHSDEILTFEHEKIQKLKGALPLRSSMNTFLDECSKCAGNLQKELDKQFFIKVLRANKQQSKPEVQG